VLKAQNADISLAASRDLLVATSFGTPNTLDLGFFALTLTATRNLTIDRGFTIIAGSSDGGVSLTAANGNITLSGASGVAAGLITASQLAELSPTAVRASSFGSILTMNAGQSISLADAVLTGPGVSAPLPLDTIDLSAGRGITQLATGIIQANTLTSSNGVTGDVRLLASNNTLFSVNGFAVDGGNFVLVNSGNLTLKNTISGNSVFVEVNKAGGILTLGEPPDSTNGIPATLVANTGRVSLVADAIDVAAISGNSITGATVELAPFSAINTSLLGQVAPSQLLIGSTLLSIINSNGGTLEVGGFTNLPIGATTATPSASSISIDGPVNLAATISFPAIATTLRLDTTGAITEPTGSLSVTNLTGSADSATISSPGNQITNLGNFITSSNFVLQTATPLIIDGTVKAGAVTAPNPANSATIALTAFGGLQIGAGKAGIINAGTVTLTANGGSITEANGVIGANSFSATATASEAGGSDVQLTSPSNKIGSSTGITAGGGNVELVDDSSLVLTGLHQGNNLFFDVVQQGGGLVLGDANTPATLSAATGRVISLIADTITSGNPNSSITVSFGTVELAPFSRINESVAGTSGSGQLLIDATLLSTINTSAAGPLDTLVIGGFTNQPANAAAPVASASSITIDGPLDLSARTFTLNLLSNGTVAEPGGPVTVSNVIGSAIGTFSLANPNNAINGSFGVTATSGDVILVDQADLLLSGSQSGNNLFFEVARSNGTLRMGGSDFLDRLTAATGGRISLVADQIIQTTRLDTISSPLGTLELAPFSAINTSVNGSSAAGQLLIGAQLLSTVKPTLGTLVIGGFSNAPAGAATPAPAAGSVTIDGALDLASLATVLDLQAIGSVTQSAPILHVGTLTGITGSTTLTNGGNSIATLGSYTATNNLALADATDLLIAGSVTTTGNATFTITGALNEAGSLTAGMLTGSTTGATTLAGANQIAQLGEFSAASATLHNTIDLLVSGPLTASPIAISDPTQTITLADGAVITTGGTARPPGLINLALAPSAGQPGALFQSANFVQLGTSMVLGQGGGPATMQVQATTVQFDPLVGLQARSAWLVLDLGTGTAVGNVFVNALDVSYSTPGSANLGGTIAGVTGGPAAAIGNIQPAINANYLFNGCIIAAAVCQPPAIIPPTPTVTTQVTTVGQPPAIVPPTPTLTTQVTTIVGLPSVAITSTLGGIFEVLSEAPPSVSVPPVLEFIVMPLLQSRPPQLTDPDVVPPNITYLDY
jgi:hypothetical protein